VERGLDAGHRTAVAMKTGLRANALRMKVSKTPARDAQCAQTVRQGMRALTLRSLRCPISGLAPPPVPMFAPGRVSETK
jgi:hypothetical protein